MTDFLISCQEPTAVKVEGGIEMHGTFGMIRLADDRARQMRLAGGTLLSYGEAKLTAAKDAWRGVVVRIDTSDAEDQRIVLDPPLPPDADLVGQTIHFENDLPMDTSYRIEAVTVDGISTGDVTVVKGFKNPADFAAGYTYLVNPGDRYVLPTSVGSN